jgi:hypothetical protein
MIVILFGLFEFLLNIPFGAWRVKTRKFSIPWFMAIHSAVPIIILARILTGVEYEWTTLPFYLICYGLGQYVGGKMGGCCRKTVV